MTAFIVQNFTYFACILLFSSVVPTVLVSHGERWNAAAQKVSLGTAIYMLVYSIFRRSSFSSTIFLWALLAVWVGLCAIRIYEEFKTKQKTTFRSFAETAIIVILALFGSAVVGGFTSPSTGALDPKHYTMEMVWGFSGDWVARNSHCLGPISGLFLGNQESRASVGALGWLNNFVSIGVDTWTVHRMCLFFWFLNLIQLVVSFRSLTVPALLIGSIVFAGANSIASLFENSQINQVIGSWLLVNILIFQSKKIRGNTSSIYAPSLAVGIFCSLLPLTYPELLVFLPLTLILPWALCANPDRDFKECMMGVGWGLGFAALPILFSPLIFWNYAKIMSNAAPGWNPLGHFRMRPLYLIGELFGSTEIQWIAGIQIISWILLVIWTLRDRRISPQIARGWGLLAVALAVCVALVFRSGNPNYISFKLSGWLTPIIAYLFLSILNIYQVRNSKLNYWVLWCGLTIAIPNIHAVQQTLWSWGHRAWVTNTNFVDKQVSSLVLYPAQAYEDFRWVKVLAPERGIDLICP